MLQSGVSTTISHESLLVYTCYYATAQPGKDSRNIPAREQASWAREVFRKYSGMMPRGRICYLARNLFGPAWSRRNCLLEKGEQLYEQPYTLYYATTQRVGEKAAQFYEQTYASLSCPA